MNITIENLKTCILCGQSEKSHYGGVTTKDGLRNPCKDCIRTIDRPKRPLRGMMKIGDSRFPTLKQIIVESTKVNHE